MNEIQALHELSTNLDTILFRRQPDEEDGSSAIGSIAKGAGAAGLIAGGAYGHKKIMDNYRGSSGPYAKDGGLIQGGWEGAKRAYKQAGSDIKAGAGNLVKRGKSYASAVGDELKKGKGFYKSATAGAEAGLGHGMIGGLKSAGKRVLQGVKGLKFQRGSIGAKIVELDAMTDELIELRKQRLNEFQDDRPEVGWVGRQAAVGRAMRKKGSSIFADPELIGERNIRGLTGTLKGGAVGAGSAAAIAAAAASLKRGGIGSKLLAGAGKNGRKALKGARRVLRKVDGVSAGEAVGAGALAGSVIGGVDGQMRADRDFLSKRGVKLKYGGLDAEMTPEAHAKYVHPKYRGGKYSADA